MEPMGVTAAWVVRPLDPPLIGRRQLREIHLLRFAATVASTINCQMLAQTIYVCNTRHGLTDKVRQKSTCDQSYLCKFSANHDGRS